MKKFTLFIFALAMGLFSFAQTFQMETLGSAVIENGTELKFTQKIGTDFAYETNVRNLADAVVSVGITIEHLKSESTLEEADAVFYYCWKSCYAPWSFIDQPVDIDPSGVGLFVIDHNEPTKAGVSKFKVTFYNTADPEDKIEFFYTFISGRELDHNFQMEELTGSLIEENTELRFTQKIGTDFAHETNVRNLTDAALSVGITIEHLKSESTLEETDVVFFYCWKSCYAPWGFMDEPVDIDPSGTALFVIDHNDPTKAGVSKFKVTFYNTADPKDKIEFLYTFVVEGDVALDKIATTTVKAYPNPATTHLTVEYDLNKAVNNVQVSLTNLLGVEVMREQMNTQSGSKRFDVSNFAPGIYFYTIKADGRVVETRKVIITK